MNVQDKHPSPSPSHEEESVNNIANPPSEQQQPAEANSEHLAGNTNELHADLLAAFKLMMSKDGPDEVEMEKLRVKSHQRYLASLNTPERLAKHNAVMQRFTGDGSIRDPGPIRAGGVASSMPGMSECFNPLFTLLWEPWARKVQYISNDDLDLASGAEADVVWNNQRVASIFLYSYSIPTLPLLKFMVDNAPNRKIAEIGSGNGYWSALLSRMGADVVAVDDGSELGGRTPVYYRATIVDDGVEFVQRGSADDRALFFCWARPGDMPARCIEAYKGDTVFFVGENRGHMDTFDVEEWLRSEQGKGWKVEATKEVPAWVGVVDSFVMCKRVKKEQAAAVEEACAKE